MIYQRRVLMIAITVKEASILFDSGAMTSVVVAPAPLNAGSWIMFFDTKAASGAYTLCAQREPVRIFKSSDAALATAFKIGFRCVKFKI